MKQHTILLILMTFISSLIIFNNSKIEINEATANGLYTLENEPPQEFDPLAYSALDNLSFLAYMATHNNFHSLTTGKVEALGGLYTQNVVNTRIKQDSYAFTEAITSSTFVKKYEQKFFSNSDKILVRKEESVKNDEIIWNNYVTAISKETFDELYGWYPTWLIGYIVHPESINDASLTQSGSDYKITCDMNVNVAPAYNKKEMKTYAQATDYPSFEKLTLTFTFTNNWILKSVYEESTYNINIPGLNWLECSANLLEEFYFEDKEIPDFDFFINNLDIEIGDLKEDITPLTYLQLAFGPYLTGDKKYLNGEFIYNDTLYNANLKLDIEDLSNPSIDLKFMDYYIKYENSYLYIDLLNKYKIDISKFSLENALDISNISTNFIDNAYSTILDDEIIVTMPIDLLDFNLNCSFYLTKSNELKYILINITYNLETYEIKLYPTNLEFETRSNFEEYKDISNINWLINKSIKLANAKALELEIIKNFKLNNNEFKAYANLLINNNIINGSLTIKDNSTDLKFDLYYDEYLYLTYKNQTFKITNFKLENNNTNTTSNFNYDINAFENLVEFTLNDILIKFYNLDKLKIETLDSSIFVSQSFNKAEKKEFNSYKEINIEELIALLKNDYLKINFEFLTNISNNQVLVNGLINTSNDFTNMEGEFNLEYNNTLLNVRFNIYNDLIYLNISNIEIILYKDELPNIKNEQINNDIYLKDVINIIDNINNNSLDIINFNIEKSNEEPQFIMPSNYLTYNDISNIEGFILGFKDLMNKEKIKFDVLATTSMYEATATCDIEVLNDGYINLYIDLLVTPLDKTKELISANGYIDLEIYMINNFCYVDFNGIKMKVSLDNLLDLLREIVYILKIDNPLINDLLQIDVNELNNKSNLDIFINNIPSNNNEIFLNDYINGLSINDTDLTLSLNSNNLFNQSDETYVTLSKLNNEIKSLRFDNLYHESEKFDIEFNLLDGTNINILAPTQEYQDFSSANLFVRDLYNTANAKKFELNGTISLTSSITNTFNEKLGVRIELNEDSSINQVGIKLVTPAKVNALLIFPIYITQSKKEVTSYIYYKDNYIYTLKSYGTTKLYTKDHIDDYLKNIDQNIYYLMDLSDSIKSMINSNQSSQRETMTFEKSFISYNYNNFVYSLVLNGKNLAGSDIIGNIEINMTSTNNLLTNLSGSIDKLATIFSAKYNIDNITDNPKGITEDFIPFDYVTFKEFN